MFEPAPRLPTHVWVDAVLRDYLSSGGSVYIRQKGDITGGLVLLSLFHQIQKAYNLLVQQRDLDGQLKWVPALKDESLSADIVDAYIQKAIARDPDLWVVEIEGKNFTNLFEGVV